MKLKFLAIPVLAASLAAAPMTDASAYGRGGYGGHYHHGGGPGWGLIAGVGALVGAAALLVTYPVRAAVEAAPPVEPVYAEAPPPQQGYYAPPQAYYAPAPAYYAPPPRAYYRPYGRYYY